MRLCEHASAKRKKVEGKMPVGAGGRREAEAVAEKRESSRSVSVCVRGHICRSMRDAYIAV